MARLGTSVDVHRHEFGSIAAYDGAHAPDAAMVRLLCDVQRSYNYVFGNYILFHLYYHPSQYHEGRPHLVAVERDNATSNRRGKTWQEALMGALHEVGWESKHRARDLANAGRLDDAMQSAIDDLWAAIGAAAEALNAPPSVWSRNLAEWSLQSFEVVADVPPSGEAGGEQEEAPGGTQFVEIARRHQR